MELAWRIANDADVPLLSSMNAELIQDEGHDNAMTLAELETRMRGFITGGYTAVIFERAGAPVAYALYRDDERQGVFVRQFFVTRPLRRRGLGRRAIGLLRVEVLPPNTRISLDVLTHNERALGFWRALGFRDYAMTLELV